MTTGASAVLDIAVGATDSAVIPEQPVHSVAVENLTARLLRVRVACVPGSRAIFIVIEDGPVALSRALPEPEALQN